MTTATPQVKTLESWIWDAACTIRGAKDAPKYKDFILPLIFAKRLCDVYDDELDRIAHEAGSRKLAFDLIERDHKLVRFYLPLRPEDETKPVWNVIRSKTNSLGQELTTTLKGIADHNPSLKGIIDRIDFNATTHGQRDIDDDRLSKLIEAISAKRLGLSDVEPDVIGRSYEYLIRKFAEGSGQSAGEFYTPAEVGYIIAGIMQSDGGMEVYDPCCGSAGLLIKCSLDFDNRRGSAASNPGIISLFGQESEPGTWAMANMNMIIHDMQGQVEIGDTFRRPKFKTGGRLRTFDRVVANPMWNQPDFEERDYDADQFGRFPSEAGYPAARADWGWMQHILASLNSSGRAAVVLDTGAASRGSGNPRSNREKEVRRWFIEQDLIDGVIYLPSNLFYNTAAPGIIVVMDRAKDAHRAGRLFLLNAKNEFKKGDPKNFVPQEAIDRITSVYRNWTEVERYSRIVPIDEIRATDYNISPNKYVDPDEVEGHRPIDAIVEDLRTLEASASDADANLTAALKSLGIEL